MGLPPMSDEKVPFQTMTLDNTHNQLQWRSYIFGPYYPIVQGAFPSSNSEIDKPSTKKTRMAAIIGFAVLILGIIPLLARTIWIIMQLMTTTLFTLNWSMNFIFFMLSLHSIFALVTLFLLGKDDFYNDFTRRSLIAIKNQVPSRNPFTVAHVLLGIFFCYFIFTYVFYIAENYTDYDHFVTNVNESSANYRKSLFGGGLGTYWLDGIILVWAAFVSALALVIYNLVSNTLVSDYTKFNEELREASKAGQLAHADLLNNYGTRQLELLDLARHAYSKFGLLVTFTFLAGFVTHSLAGFIMRSFAAEGLPGIMQASTLLFVILGLLMLLADVKRTSDFAHQLTETANILMFERSIYSQMDEKLSQISNNIIFRIEHTHYLPKAFSSFKINEKFFQRAFLIFPFLIEFLNAVHKNLP